VNFVQAISNEQYAYVYLGGQKVQVYRQKLGGHIQLLDIAAQMSAHKEHPLMAASLIVRYLDTAGVNPPIIKAARPTELIQAFLTLYALNGWAWVIPLIDPKRADGRPSQPPPYDYAGRRWAVWIHRIAMNYGWSRDDILNLWPEEAAVYIQEILIQEHGDREERRSLSKLSYQLDKGSNTYNFVPSPKPSWMIDPEPKMIRIRRSLMPVGNVIGKDSTSES
jgi:hypothetical protein